MECIILAGGLGTRLQSVIGEYPKCMAEVNGQPFLHYLLKYVAKEGCTRVILSLGFKSEVVLDWLKGKEFPFEVDHVIEEEPLGTGGGISLAMSKAKTESVVVLNGDTMFQAPLKKMIKQHEENEAGATLALKKMQNFDRYGVVNFGNHGIITSFEEKKQRDEGYINGGVYILAKGYLEEKDMPEKYSFEKDFLERYVRDQWLYSYPCDAYFIDIGIPTDYEKAQTDFKELF